MGDFVFEYIHLRAFIAHSGLSFELVGIWSSAIYGTTFATCTNISQYFTS